MYGMFEECPCLETLDLSSFTISEDVEFSLYDSSGLKSIVTPKECNADVILPLKRWVDKDGNEYSRLPKTSVIIESGSLHDNDNIAEGTSNEVSWSIDKDGKLTVQGTGNWEKDFYIDELPLHGYYEQDCPPWYVYASEIKSAEIELTGTTDASAMFQGCKNLEYLNLDNFDTSELILANSMFCECRSLKSLDLSMLDTQNLESMRGMFASCERLQSLDIKSFDTSNVSDMSGLFANCHSLGTIEWSSKFVTAKVTNMTSMFGSCESFEELYIEGFDTSNVTNMYGMFADCFKLKTLKFGEKFDTSQVTDMGAMFAEDYELTELDLSSFTISADTDADAFFCDTYSLNYIVTPKKCDASVMVPPRGEWKDVNGTVYTSLPRTSKIISNSPFKKEFTITYELNGGTNNKANPSSYKSSLTVTLKNPSKAGYTFGGWFDNAEFSGEKIKTVKAKDITLYAKWAANVYTVTFNGNGGNYTPEGAKKATATKKQSFTYDESANLEANVFARKGYTFTGWNTKKDGKGKAYEPGAEVLNLTKTNKGNINLYAQWKANEYTIHFDINAEEVYIGDHTGNMDDVTVKYAKTVKLPANNFTKKGYSFKGWSTDKDATKAQYKNKASVKNLAIEDGKVVTLYAVWSINTYNVKFVANGGKGKTFTIKGCKYGEKLIKWPENTFTNKDLYTFGGWVVGNFVYPVGQEDNLEATKNNQTFTASAAWLFDIEICIGEENKIIENAIYNCPVSIEEFEYYLPELAKTGYYLAGFATSKKNADKGKCAYTKSVKNVAGKVLYPVYKPIKYTVKFDKNAPDGAKVTGKMSNVSATYGKAFTLKANAYKCSGHKFLGWSTKKDATEPEFTNKAKIEESLSTTNKDVITLYAIWQ